MKLLIVDDSLIIRNKIDRCILQRFSEVMHAENGKQALEVVIANKPDVITMDLTMPHMSGNEAVKEIIKIAPNTRIFVVSALADKATAISALTYGANGFLCKPFSAAELNSAIERIINVELSA